MGIGAAMARLGLVLTPLVAQYLIHLSLPVALLTYATVCVACVVCIRQLPLETVGRQMPSTTDALLHTLRSSSGGRFATDTRAHCVWRTLRWYARVDGVDVLADARDAKAKNAARKGIVRADLGAAGDSAAP
eukprot:COSAG02_NODE_191_length_30004_cov_86.740980_9_plen_132_part_00